MFFLPYSPRWLTKQGRSEEAKSTIIRLHGGEKKAKMDLVNAEFMEMQVQIDWGKFDLSRPWLLVVCEVLIGCREGESVDQLLGPVQNSTELASNSLWLSGPGYDTVRRPRLGGSQYTFADNPSGGQESM